MTVNLYPSAYSDYQKAEFQKKKLLKNTRLRQYRSNWIKVIDMFLSIPSRYPHSHYISCAYLEAGKLYLQLFKFSRTKKDRESARYLFRKAYRSGIKNDCTAEALYRAVTYDRKYGSIANATRVYHILKTSFPSSKWRRLAERVLKENPSTVARRNDPSRDYNHAEKEYRRLITTRLKQYRHNWFRVIRLYEKIITRYPHSRYAFKSYMKIGFMYEQLYRYGLDTDDLKSARDYYLKGYKKFSSYPWSVRALYFAGKICFKLRDCECALSSLKGFLRKGRKTKYYSEAEKIYSRVKTQCGRRKKIPVQVSSKIVIKGVRYWSSKNYTRVVIYSDKPFIYQEHYLPENKRYRKPPRFYFDIENAILPADVPRQVAINDGLLKAARIGQFKKDVVRVVLDLASVGRYTAFTLEDPFRLVIDVFGKGKVKHLKKRKKKLVQKKKRKKYAYVKKTLTIVIDPGHGGKDSGAVCCGIKEKNITLGIALKLAEILRHRLGARVVLTRDSDVFIPLEERTALANTENADAFISIHVNSTPQRGLRAEVAPAGATVYYLGKAYDFSARRVARIENQSAHVSYRKDWIGSLINELEKYYKKNDSIKLAKSIQKYLNSLAPSYDPYYKVHHIAGAPFYVLVNTSMPAVLVETGFINNPEEGKLLTTPAYQKVIAEAIYKGLEEFFETYVAETY